MMRMLSVDKYMNAHLVCTTRTCRRWPPSSTAAAASWGARRRKTAGSLQVRVLCLPIGLTQSSSTRSPATPFPIVSGGKDAFDTVSSCQRVTVTELCARFELNMLLRAETLRSPDRKAQPETEQSHDRSPTGREKDDDEEETEEHEEEEPAVGVGGAGGAQAGRLTAMGVQELRSFFEVYSKRHVEKQCKCYEYIV